MADNRNNRPALKRRLCDGVAAVPEPHQRHGEYSNLGTKVLSAWAWGSMPASEVQRIAHAAARDGLDHPEILELAELGSYGTFAGNVHQQLMNIYGGAAVPLAAPFSFKVNAWDTKSSTIKSTITSAL